MNKQTIFFNEELQTKFENNGFVKIKLLEPAEVDHLLDFYTSEIEKNDYILSDFSDKEYTIFSVFHTKKEFRKIIFDTIYNILKPKIEKILKNYKPMAANYIVKYPHKGILDVHQNAVLVDEEKYTSLSVWCAMQDTTTENGTLYFIKGSHKIFRGLRSSFTHLPFKNIQKYLISRYMIPVEAKKGEAIILDDSIIHFSDINKTDNKRISAHLILVPQEAPTFFLECENGSATAKMYDINEDYFFNVRNIESADRSEMKFVREVEVSKKTFTRYSFDSKWHSSDTWSLTDKVKWLLGFSGKNSSSF